MPNTTSHLTSLQGWTPSPTSRGTLTILSSSFFTIFLCIWTILCPNINPTSSSFSSKALQKLKLAIICVLGPDFLLLLVVGQWESARRSLFQFRERGFGDWTMIHAFYADMGGFVVRTRDGVKWPLDANQLFYLIEEGWITESVIVEQVVLHTSDINDRNKQNPLVRIFTIAQILWFWISFVARWCQHLAVTTLEVTTIGFIVTTVGVSIFWFNKPADIETQRTIDINATIAEIHVRAGLDQTYEWYETPLDFMNPERTYPEVARRYCLAIVSAFLRLRGDPPGTPITRRRDDNFPTMSHCGMLVPFICGIISWGANLLAWNFDFPTTAERHLWRACSLILIATAVIGELCQEILLRWFPDMKKEACDRFAAGKLQLDDKQPKQDLEEKRFARRLERQGRIKTAVLRLSNISPNGDPSLTMPLRVLFPALFCAAAYALARLYLLVEDLIAFRGQNSDVYKTVDWVDFLPHV